MAIQAHRTLNKAQAALLRAASDEELRELCAGAPEYDFSALSDDELEAIIDGVAPAGVLAKVVPLAPEFP
jgi:hypothetical protein